MTTIAAFDFKHVSDEGVSLFIMPFDESDHAIFQSGLQTLSSEELQRMQRFVFMKDGHRYGIARILLRAILAHYLECRPEDVVLLKGPYGKPYVMSSQNIDFNISHCEGCIVVAIAHAGKIGVDVESIVVPQPDYEIVAQSYFSEAEYISVIEGKSQGFSLFIELWTLKEAYLKAIGRGLSKAMRDCEFSFSGNRSLHFVDHRLVASTVVDWYFESHDVLDSFRLSFATDIQGSAPVSIYVLDSHCREWRDGGVPLVKPLFRGRSETARTGFSAAMQCQ